MDKRGQVTLFIIIAIVIIAVVVLGLIFWPTISTLFMSQQQTESFLASQAESLRDAVYDCVLATSYPAFERIGLQAGYYDTTGLERLDFAGNSYIVVMYKDAAKQRINKLPSETQIEEQFSLFLEREGYAEIDSCLNNFASFKRNMNVEPGERKMTATINPDSIMINVDWPIKISKQTARAEAEQTINQIPATLTVPLGNLWYTANRIVDCETQVDCNYEGLKWDEETWNDPYTLQYISRDARSINKDQIVFILESVPHRIGEFPYKFNFAVDRT
ncbi:MAG: hypothetical protein IB618_02285 [Candidatus Pacearchaeota archaeon]|nr:MAG: hypothetical protein IB618_02285 [Candidatus Pacearchaeota archaeon]